ncbi:uncharacterized conserved protein UCP032756 [Pyrolobus fumarii 1A]|uniref:Uncharacterized conserved protein UCP032756 n=2 Tax=Pyrolobus fumarii TaxID=54252 RepID=G0ECK4_PYRF1|nr:uncharacterized conserved protein UCP032756 [Pyrolobus fumarii 1A]
METEEIHVPILVVKSVEGQIEEVKIVDDKSLTDVLREYVKKAADEWNPQLSDLTVMRTHYELRYKIPIDPDLYDIVTGLGLELEREGNEVIVRLPVFTISYDNRWSGDTYRDIKVYVVTYLIEDSIKDQIVEYAKETTAREKSLGGETQLELTPEQLQRLEEGLSEVEAVEAAETQASSGKKRRRSRKKKSS